MQHRTITTSAAPPPRLASVPTYLALLAVATVWAFGAWWSFSEQRAFAAAHHFEHPELLPAIIDGLSIALALVAYAAAIDGRPAIGARLGTALAVAASASANGIWAFERSYGNWITVAVAVIIPIAAMLAFETFLHELRHQVQRKRGEPVRRRIPRPPLIRLVLAFGDTWHEWRQHVLDITALRPPVNSSTEQATPDMAAQQQRPPEAATAAIPSAVAGQPADIERPADTAADSTAAPGHMRPDSSDTATTPTRDRNDTTSLARPASAPVAGAAEQQDDRVEEIADKLLDGEEYTAKQIAELYGCSVRTGRRLRSQALQLLATNDAGGHLHVVGQR